MDHPEIVDAYRAMRQARRAINNKYQGVKKADEAAIVKKQPTSAKMLAETGISNSRKCANVLGAIALDVLQERITPQVGNTACNAIGKLIQIKTLEIKYGTSPNGGVKRLELTD